MRVPLDGGVPVACGRASICVHRWPPRRPMPALAPPAGRARAASRDASPVCRRPPSGEAGRRRVRQARRRRPRSGLAWRTRWWSARLVLDDQREVRSPRSPRPRRRQLHTDIETARATVRTTTNIPEAKLGGPHLRSSPSKSRRADAARDARRLDLVQPDSATQST
jgi:hypothetical protein